MLCVFIKSRIFLCFSLWFCALTAFAGICSADSDNLLSYEETRHDPAAHIRARNDSGNREFPGLQKLAQAGDYHEHNLQESNKEIDADAAKELIRPESLHYPLFLGLCCGKCGGNMPLNIPGGGTPEPHEFRIKTNLNWMKMVGLRRGTHNRSRQDALKQYMAVPRKMDMTMGNFSIGYAFSDRFFLGAMGMYMNKDMSMINRENKKSKMQSQGVGDTMLMTKTLVYADDLLFPTNQVSVLLGLSIPTGSIDQDQRGSLLPYSMQLGSGTFDPFVGILYEGSRTPLWWGFNISYLSRLYENYKSYNLGDKFQFDLYGMYQIRHDLVAELQFNGKYTGDIEGQAREIQQGGTGHMMGNPNLPFMSNLFDPDNYGGSSLDVRFGVQWQPFHNHILNAQIAFPLFQNLHGTQMEQDFTATLSYYVEFPLGKSRRFSKERSGLDILGF
ncbi:MAG: transporter [Candidatus Scalindua sp.]|nr:transporter [Candidatus Scalindua sp.]